MKIKLILSTNILILLHAQTCLQEEVIRSRKKKKKARRVKQRDLDEDEFEEQVQEELAFIPRPRLTDLIPCKMVTGVIAMVMAVPGCVVAAREELRERMKPKKEEGSDEEEEGRCLM